MIAIYFGWPDFQAHQPRLLQLTERAKNTLVHVCIFCMKRGRAHYNWSLTGIPNIA